jgi:hypothetical protein
MDTARLTWIPPLAVIEGYILTYRAVDGTTEVMSQNVPGSIPRAPAVGSLVSQLPNHYPSNNNTVSEFSALWVLLNN